jgi:hypothetical protein
MYDPDPAKQEPYNTRNKKTTRVSNEQLGLYAGRSRKKTHSTWRILYYMLEDQEK